MNATIINRFVNKPETSLIVDLEKMRQTKTLFNLSKIVLDYDLDNDTRLDLTFDKKGECQIIWEYIWLSVMGRKALGETNDEIFNVEEDFEKFQLLCAHFEAHSSFSIEQRLVLFDFLHQFMIADKIGDSDAPTVASAVNVAPTAAPTNVMDIDKGDIVDGYVNIDRSLLERLLETTTDKGDVFVSKFDLPIITVLDQGKILEKVNAVAGTRVTGSNIFCSNCNTAMN
jgi:hypothetical protein